MNEIKNLNIKDGKANFDLSMGFGEWVRISIERTKVGLSITNLEDLLPIDEVDDETFNEIEEMVYGLADFILYATWSD